MKKLLVAVLLTAALNGQTDVPWRFPNAEVSNTGCQIAGTKETLAVQLQSFKISTSSPFPDIHWGQHMFAAVISTTATATDGILPAVPPTYQKVFGADGKTLVTKAVFRLVPAPAAAQSTPRPHSEVDVMELDQRLFVGAPACEVQRVGEASQSQPGGGGGGGRSGHVSTVFPVDKDQY